MGQNDGQPHVIRSLGGGYFWEAPGAWNASLTAAWQFSTHHAAVQSMEAWGYEPYQYQVLLLSDLQAPAVPST